VPIATSVSTIDDAPIGKLGIGEESGVGLDQSAAFVAAIIRAQQHY